MSHLYSAGYPGSDTDLPPLDQLCREQDQTLAEHRHAMAQKAAAAAAAAAVPEPTPEPTEYEPHPALVDAIGAAMAMYVGKKLKPIRDQMEATQRELVRLQGEVDALG